MIEDTNNTRGRTALAETAIAFLQALRARFPNLDNEQMKRSEAIIRGDSGDVRAAGEIAGIVGGWVSRARQGEAE